MSLNKRQIKKFIDGDNQSMAELYEEYSVGLNFLAFKYLKDIDDAYDAVMDVFNKLMQMTPEQRKLKIPEDPEKIGAWLYTIARNYCLDLIKHKQVVNNFAHDSISAQESSVESDVLRKWDKQIIDEVMHKLNNAEQQILELHLNGYSHQEIAQQLSLSYNTVRNQVFSAKSKIKKYISGLLIVFILIL